MNDELERTYDEFGDTLDNLVMYVATGGDLFGPVYDGKRLALFLAASQAFSTRPSPVVAPPCEPCGLLTVCALDGRYQP